METKRKKSKLNDVSILNSNLKRRIAKTVTTVIKCFF